MKDVDTRTTRVVLQLLILCVALTLLGFAFCFGMAYGLSLAPEVPKSTCARPTDPSCPCVDYAVSIPNPGWGFATCRADQVGTVTPSSTHDGPASLACACAPRGTPE